MGKLLTEKISCCFQAVTSMLGEKMGLICADDQDAVFDRFYYIGQAVLDNVSDKNSAVDNQENRIHLTDVLVSLAVQDVLLDREERGLQLQMLKLNDSNFITGNDVVMEFISEIQLISGLEIDMMDPNLQRSTKAENEKEKEKWYYYKMEALPAYIKLCRADFTADDRRRNVAKKENYIGCIDVGRVEISRLTFGRTIHWALDMGTRNTIAAYRADDERSISVQLVKDKLYCPLLLAIEKIHRDFSRQCFSPRQGMF